jgi:alpha-acetolactate decarboxylase
VVALRKHADLGLHTFEGLDGEVVVAEGVAGELLFRVVVRQIVVHHIKRISFSLTEVLRFGIAC